MNGLYIDTKRLTNGRLTSVVYNSKGQAVADLQSHNFTAEEVISAARQLRAKHPELFGDEILIDTAAESIRKNETAFGDGLEPIPGN